MGKNNYTVFLTADHGGADVPHHLMDKKIPAGYINEEKLTKTIKDYFKTNYANPSLLEDVSK